MAGKVRPYRLFPGRSRRCYGCIDTFACIKALSADDCDRKSGQQEHDPLLQSPHLHLTETPMRMIMNAAKKP